MLKAENVVKSYGDNEVLAGIDSSVQLGQCLGVLGPNGSGKSTLLKCLTGERMADQGEVLLDGKALASYPPKERAQRIAVLPQEGVLPLPITVEDFLLMGREPYQNWLPWYQQADFQLVEKWIEQLELEAFRTKSLVQLSGGQRQRVAIAQAMVQSPQYLLLDEPMSHLDLQYQCFVLDLLTKLKKQRNLGMMIILHDINLAAQYCDQLLFLAKGKIIGYGKPHEVIYSKMMERVYGIQTVVIEHPELSCPQILLTKEGI